MANIDFQPIEENKTSSSPGASQNIDFEISPDDANEADTFLGRMPKNPSILPKSYQDLKTQMEEGRQNFKKALPGFSQGYVNSLIDVANLLPSVNVKKLDLLPHDPMTQTGEMAGDVASYFGPRAAIGMIKAPHAISNALHNMPVAKAILRNMGSTAEAALFGASHAKEGEKESGAEEAGLIGSGMHIVNSLLSHKMPLLARLGAIGAGTALGQLFGHPYYGGLIGGFFPQLKGAVIGPSRTVLAENALRDINPQKIQKPLAANEALGTVPTPGQASGRYTVLGREGALRKQAGALGEDLERESLEQQNKAAKDMLNKIYKPSKKNEAEIEKAYTRANTGVFSHRPMHEIDQIKSDPIMKDAFEGVKRQSAFKNIPENNYEFLAQVNRDLFTDYKLLAKSPNSGDRVQARKIKDARLAFDNYLKSNNPDYKKAAALAAPKYARQEIEDVKLNLHDEKLTGKNVYSRLLETPKKYKAARRILKPYPKALKSLENMREGWQEYANIKSGSQAEAQAKSRIDQARNILDKVNDFLQSNIGKRATEAQLKYIHSPEWKRGFALIEQAKNHRDAVNKTLDLVGKMGIAYGLSNSEIDNLKSMMTSSD